MLKMASAKFLEEALSTDVDESAMSAVVGCLKTQFTTPSSSLPHRALGNQNSVGVSDGLETVHPKLLISEQSRKVESEDNLNLMSNGAKRSSVVGVHGNQHQQHPGGPTMTVNVTSGSSGVAGNNNSQNKTNNVLTKSQVGMTMTMAPISTSLASMSPAPASTVGGSNNTLVVNSLESQISSSQNNLIPNINHLTNRSESDGGKTVLLNNSVIPHNPTGGTPNGLQSLGVHNSAGSTSSSNSVLTSQQHQQQQHLGMTVNMTGGGQTNPNQNQAVVLGKHHPQAGIVPSSNPHGSVNPVTLGGTTSTSLSGSGNSVQQAPTIISTAGGGIRILNMNVNAVQAAAVGAGNPGNVQAGGVPGNAAQKALAPRMILSPQMIGARPGQPGVQEYQSEFSEFLMLNYKQNVNEEPEREGREDDSVGDDPGFSKSTEDILSNDDIPPVVEECPTENAKSKDLDIENELTLDPDSKLSDSELFPEQPSLTLTPIVDETDLSPEKSDCSEMSFLQAFPTQYDCVQAPPEQNLPESVCCDIDEAVHTGKDSNYSNETTFYSASHQEQNLFQKQSNTELPDNSKLPACQLAVPSEVSFNQDFNSSRSDREISDLLYNSSGDEADRAAKDYGRQSLIVSRSLPHTPLPVSTSQSFLNSPQTIRYSAYSPLQSVVTMTSSCFSHQKVPPQQQQHTSPPVHSHDPPQPHQQQIPPVQQHQHNSSNNKFTSIPSEYKTKCFTNDAQLQSQFLRYNQQHPINVPQNPNKASSGTRLSLSLSQNHHAFPQQHPYGREVAPPNYNNQISIPTAGQIDSSSRSVTNVQHGSVQSPSFHPRSSVMPNSGCDYFPPSTSSSAFSYPHHHLQPPHPPGQHHGHAHASMPGQPHNRIIPQHQPPVVPRPALSTSKIQTPNSYAMNPRWMAISPNNSSGNISNSSSVSKDGCVNSPVIRFGQTLREPSGNMPTNPHIPYHSPVSANQVPTNRGYIVSYNNSRMPASGNRYPVPPQRQNVQEQRMHANVVNSSNIRVQNMSQSRPMFPQYVQEHYSRPAGGSQCMQNQQYFQAGSSGGGSHSGSNTSSSISNGSQHPGSYPLVCRVSPIRSRYEDPSSNFPVTPYPQSGTHYPSRPIPHAAPSVPGSLAAAQDPNTNFQAVASGAGRQDFNYPYESQYSDARNLRTQITLQALPGLPPGAQGHHLLVKTENGQYQLLRVGMSTQPQAPPTAASGTNPPPPPAPTTSIAQSSSTPSIISSSSVASSSSVMTTSLQQPNLNVAAMTPTNNVNIVTSNSGTAVLNSIMANAVNSPRLPMATSNLVHTNNISAVPTASSNSVISSTTIPSPVLPASPHATATYRLQTVPTVPPTAASNSSGMGMTMQPQVYPQHPQTVQGSPSVASNASATANSVSQMTAETAKMKCKNFLSFLLELSAKQNATVARNVKTLIQGLVDGKVNAEDFSDRLQKEVNSQPQPCLVGFLKKSLPHLRQSLATKELTIDGIKAPALSSIAPTAPVTALIPQNQVRPQTIPTPVRIITPINASSSPNTTSSSASIPRSTVAAVQQRFATPSKSNAPSARSNTSSKSNASLNAATSSPSASVLSSSSTPKSSGPSSSKANAKDKDKKGAAAAAAFSGYSGDDDINDVAAMGGVNLAEESQRILGSTEFVGTQIRSCKDESFLPAMLLQSRIKATASKYGLEDSAPEVAAMISHATEERLKNLLEKLSVIAEHRLDVIKIDERYEISQDVKGQLRFLEELDKLERKRHDEQEREILIKAAKSRSKSEDPEQAKLKAKAKEMQRVALEEMRQREANLTALQAIGPRKKPKLDTPAGSQSTTAQASLGVQGASSNLSRPQIGMRPRLKRVNLRDLLFLMEQDKETQRSHFLYKNLLLK